MPKIKRAIFAWSGIVCFTIFADDERKPKPLDRWVEYYKEVAKGNDDFFILWLGCVKARA